MIKKLYYKILASEEELTNIDFERLVISLIALKKLPDSDNNT